MEDPIVCYSRDQRQAVGGEPLCIVCGRYGAYVCDNTDADVCSLECKAKHLATLAPKPGLDKKAATALRAKLSITVSGSDVVAPILSFDDITMPPHVRAAIAQAGYDVPTPVQMQTLPCILTGRDVLVSAATGAGKSMCFALPLVLSALQSTPSRSLILAPTRELCLQTDSLITTLLAGLQGCNLLRVAVVGGQSIRPQIHRLKAGAMIICGTPGRLIDIVRHNKDISLGSIATLVVDEVDKMLSMGFEKEVKEIIGQLEATRQTIMLSATISPAVEVMVSHFLRHPLYISVAKSRRGMHHTVLWMSDQTKKDRLLQLLKDKDCCHFPLVVFVESRQGTEMLANTIKKTIGLEAKAIHGGMIQDGTAKRANDMASIGDYPVLVTTGLLGRGLDVASVRQVVIFDMPTSIEEYEHQIGRANHLGESGWAITFVCTEDGAVLPDLAKRLAMEGEDMPVELRAYLHSEKKRPKEIKEQGIREMVVQHVAKRARH